MLAKGVSAWPEELFWCAPMVDGMRYTREAIKTTENKFEEVLSKPLSRQ